eukprot:Skav221279  [mRNA]  locus=scaffold2775:155234:155569:+ [translate_table: standard]
MTDGDVAPRSLLVENGPEDSSILLVRPEVLHLWPMRGETYAPRTTFAPGDVLFDLVNSAWAVRVAAEARCVGFGLGTGEASQRCVVYRQFGGRLWAVQFVGRWSPHKCRKA